MTERRSTHFYGDGCNVPHGDVANCPTCYGKPKPEQQCPMCGTIGKESDTSLVEQADR